MKKTLFSVFFVVFIIAPHGIGCAQEKVDSLQTVAAPDSFKVVFKTSKGDFTVISYRSWSPKGVDRFYELINSGFYDSVVIYRVVKGFVAQFGLCNNAAINNYWQMHPIGDEPVKQSNAKWTISFARSTKDSRTTQLFINLKDNPFLDNMDYGGAVGFPPIAKIIDGFKAVEDLYGGYREEPTEMQGEIAAKGMTYTKEVFPNLDYIIYARVAQ